MKKRFKFFIGVILSVWYCSNVFSQKTYFFSGYEFNTGASYGWTQYYEDWESTFPEFVDSHSYEYVTPDIRYFRFMIEATSEDRISYHIGIGYKEFWNGLFVKDLYFGNLGLNSQVGVYTLVDFNLGYSFPIYGFELKPLLGISNFFTSNTTYYYKSANIGDDVKVGPITTTQTANYFLTLDGGLSCRYWIKRIGIGLSGHYSQGIMKMNESEGNFDWKGNIGSVKGFSRGSHSTIEMQLLYKFKKNKK